MVCWFLDSEVHEGQDGAVLAGISVTTFAGLQVSPKTPPTVSVSRVLTSGLEDIVRSSELKRQKGLQTCLNELLGVEKLVTGLSLYKTLD